MKIPAISSKTLDRYYNLLREYGTHVFVPDGATFKELETSTVNIGTTTSESDSINNFGVQGVYFNGGAYADISGVFSGTIPGVMSFSAWVEFDNWANNANHYIFRALAGAGHEYRFFKFSNNSIFLYHNQAGTLTQIFFDVSNLVGVHHLGFTMSPTYIAMYLDGKLVTSGTPAAAPTGTMTTQILGASTTTSARMVGTLFDVLIDNTRAYPAGQMAELYHEGLA